VTSDFDLHRGHLRCGGQDVTLKPKAWNVFRYLAAGLGRSSPSTSCWTVAGSARRPPCGAPGTVAAVRSIALPRGRPAEDKVQPS